MASGPYTFTRRSAERIGRVVRDIERGGRDQRSVKFRNTGGGEGVGPIRLAKPIEDIDKDSAGQVQLCRENDAEVSGEGECVALGFESDGDPVCAQNLIGDVKEGDWVYVTQVDGGEAWHIIGRQDQAQPDACGRVTRDLLPLTFSACRGSGAKATAHLAGNCPGPIESVDLEAGGSGYAIKARVAPTLNVTGSGDDAEFTVTLAEDAGACGDTTWSIESVAVNGGTGYRHGERLVVAPEEPSTYTKQSAILTLATLRSEPTLSALVCCGGGASLTVSVASSGGSPESWHVDSVTVASGGSGYPDRASVSFQLGSGDVCKAPASATIRTVREEPTLEAKPGATGGTGAVLSVSLATTTDAEGRDIWTVSGVSVTTSGTGYKVGGQVVIRCTDGVQAIRAFASITSIDESGGIDAVAVASAGQYYKDTGEIDVVTVTNGGIYFHEAPDSVTVTRAGKYYLEDPEGTPYVADVTVSLAQIAPSAGAGATFSATVDDDPESATFGQIIAVTIDDAGDNYVDQGYDYPLTWSGMKFSDLPGYDGSAVQILGHAAGGCLSWFNITTCDEDTSGVCCVDGEADPAHTTQAACETAGGTWQAGAATDDLPGPCCE